MKTKKQTPKRKTLNAAKPPRSLAAAACSSFRRKPAWWEKRTGVLILNADGWTRDKTPYTQPLTRDEFLGRACDSRAQWPREFLNKIIAETRRSA